MPRGGPAPRGARGMPPRRPPPGGRGAPAYEEDYYQQSAGYEESYESYPAEYSDPYAAAPEPVARYCNKSMCL